VTEFSAVPAYKSKLNIDEIVATLGLVIVNAR
jgi:hypothetical protein